MSGPYYVPVRQATNGLAVASFILGFFWLFWMGSILAVIFGHVALGQIKRNSDAGRGLAIAGLWLGYAGVATFMLAFVVVPFISGFTQ